MIVKKIKLFSATRITREILKGYSHVTMTATKII